MTRTPDKRSRMIFDLPEYIQTAIRLRSVKDNCSTGDVVEKAITTTFPNDVTEAKTAIKDRT